jgi:hypothetical protein
MPAAELTLRLEAQIDSAFDALLPPQATQATQAPHAAEPILARPQQAAG